MTDQELKDLVASLAIESAKTNLQIQELKESQLKTDEQLAKTDLQLAKTDKQLAKTDLQLAKTDLQLAKTDAKLDVDFDLFIPEKYIPGEMERITVYHRLVNFSEGDQIDEMKLELEDRFGKLPQEVVHFLSAVEIKLLAARLYAKRIVLKSDRMKLFFAEDAQHDDRFFAEIIPQLMQQKKTAVRFMDQKDLAVEIKLQGHTRIDTLDFAKIFLRTITENG